MPPTDHADTKHPATADLSLTRVLSALSDPLRLGIVCLLSDGQERQWGELDAAATSICAPTTSKNASPDSWHPS